MVITIGLICFVIGFFFGKSYYKRKLLRHGKVSIWSEGKRIAKVKIESIEYED
jgi:hypothetical protein